MALDDSTFCATFDADLMWRGPVWGFTNWFVMEGLETHGYDDEVIKKLCIYKYMYICIYICIKKLCMAT